MTRPPGRALAEQEGEPKYARIEFERRWLADGARRPALEGCPFTEVEDRYLRGTRMRLRRMTGRDGIQWKLTKKYGCADPAARPIVTTYLTEVEYELLRSVPAHALDKRRYHLQLENRRWSLDLFEGALTGLELLECETADRAALDALVPPDWALYEVTALPQWQGGALAAAGKMPEDAWLGC